MTQGNKEQYMRAAIAEANKAFDKQEIPIGAVVVCNDMIIARAHNLTETLKDPTDRKSTRLNSSHANISYAVFCLKKNRRPGRCPGRRRSPGGRDAAPAGPRTARRRSWRRRARVFFKRTAPAASFTFSREKESSG